MGAVMQPPAVRLMPLTMRRWERAPGTSCRLSRGGAWWRATHVEAVLADVNYKSACEWAQSGAPKLAAGRISEFRARAC